MATSSSSQSKEVLEAEVPNEIMEQFRTLQQALQQNEKLAQEFMVNTCEDDMQKLDADVERLMRILGETRADLRRERFKNHVLSERLARDSHMADLVQRRKEMLQKNPQYGRAQAIDYMHAIADEHERTLLDHESSVSRIEQTIRALSDTDADLTGMTERDLAEHIQRFDQIFAVIAAQNCAASEKVERVKEMYLEYQRKLYGRYARNPFEKRKERQKMHDAFSNLKGLDAFPSQHAVLSMSEFLPRQQAVAPMAAAPVTGFGTGSSNSLFPASKPAGSTGFGIFGQQTAANTAGVNKLPFGGAATSTTSSGANKPLFGLPSSTIATMSGFGGFSTTPASGTTSFFGNTATTSAATGTTPLFGATPAATSAGATPSLFGSATAAAPAFGSTLNSAASGTLFRGSAAGGPPTKDESEERQRVTDKTKEARTEPSPNKSARSRSGRKESGKNSLPTKAESHEMKETARHVEKQFETAEDDLQAPTVFEHVRGSIPPAVTRLRQHHIFKEVPEKVRDDAHSGQTQDENESDLALSGSKIPSSGNASIDFAATASRETRRKSFFPEKFVRKSKRLVEKKKNEKKKDSNHEDYQSLTRLRHVENEIEKLRDELKSLTIAVQELQKQMKTVHTELLAVQGLKTERVVLPPTFPPPVQSYSWNDDLSTKTPPIVPPRLLRQKSEPPEPVPRKTIVGRDGLKYEIKDFRKVQGKLVPYYVPVLPPKPSPSKSESLKPSSSKSGSSRPSCTPSKSFESVGKKPAPSADSPLLLMTDKSKSSREISVVGPLKSSQKRVTFKVELPSINHAGEKLDAVMRYANEVMKHEAENQQLMKDTKGLYPMFHAQCLTRYKIEKALNDKTSQDAVIKAAEEKHREYMEIVARHVTAGGN